MLPPMRFLDRLSEDERQKLLAASRTLHLGRGEALLRRGERGGDVYLLEAGTLEVLDTRNTPAVVLDTVPAGDLVGEMAFVDQSTRSADVRAAEDSVCRHWPRDTLMALIDADASLGRSLYRAFADLVIERSRHLSGLAASGALGHAPLARTASAVVDRLAEPVRGVMMQVEPELRRDRAQAEATIVTVLDRLQAELHEAMAMYGAAERRTLGLELARLLHPYTIRSHLAELTMDRPSGFTEEPQALDYLHRAQPDGDGELGEIIDGWLLSRPTAVGIRQRERTAAARCQLLLADDQQVLLLNTARSPLLAAMADELRRRDCAVTLVESDRVGLARGLDLLASLPDGRVRPFLTDLAGALLSGQNPDVPRQDLIIVPGLLDYLPDRAAARLLRGARALLKPGGVLVLTALAPSPDAPIYHYLLDWPTVRRKARALSALVERAGLRVRPGDPVAEPGLLLIAERASKA